MRSVHNSWTVTSAGDGIAEITPVAAKSSSKCQEHTLARVSRCSSGTTTDTWSTMTMSYFCFDLSIIQVLADR